MIIFYHKKTGEIVGTIGGRVHHEEELKMWIGDQKETERIIIQWEPVRFFNQEGKRVKKGSPEVFTADYEPKHPQKKIFLKLEQDQLSIYDYKVSLKTKKLVSK